MTKIQNRKLIHMTSYNERLKHVCIAISDYTIYLYQIRHKHKYRTINTPEWPNSHKVKIQDGGGRHLKFRKYVNNLGLDKDILQTIIQEDASRSCGDDHMTESRNRKLFRMTSPNEHLKHMCIDISDCNRYLNQI